MVLRSDKELIVGIKAHSNEEKLHTESPDDTNCLP